jgi:DNA-binding CsgD family transcriptional regulator
MTRRASRSAARATDCEVRVVAAILVAGSEKAAAHRLGLSHSTVKHHLANARFKTGATTTARLVWILSPRLPEAIDANPEDESRLAPRLRPSSLRRGGDDLGHLPVTDVGVSRRVRLFRIELDRGLAPSGCRRC